MSGGDVVVFGVGARTHNALTSLQVAMGFRADKSDPRETHLVDRDGEPMVMCRLASIGDDVVGWPRLTALALPSLRQALLPILSGPARAPLPLYVALPEVAESGATEAAIDAFLDALVVGAPAPIARDRSEALPRGRGAGVEAIERAIHAVESGGRDLVVVGGVDSYYDASRLEYLDADLRLHSLSCENGFIPGEGAAFALIGRRGAISTPALGFLHGVSVRQEPKPYGAALPCLAEGMTDAVHRVTTRAGLGDGRIGWMLTDVVNERHRVDEWMYVVSRAHAAFSPDAVHDQPLLCTGDLGAASAPVLLSIAVTMWQAGCAPSDWALVAAHSDGPARGAFVVRRGDVRHRSHRAGAAAVEERA